MYERGAVPEQVLPENEQEEKLSLSIVECYFSWLKKECIDDWIIFSKCTGLMVMWAEEIAQYY